MATEKVLIEIDVDNKDAINALKKQNEEIQELEESQKKLADSGEENTEMYKKQADQLSKLKKERGDAVKGLNAEAGSMGKASKGVGMLGNSFKGLDTILKASLLGAILALLMGLFDALSKTKGGAEAMEKAMAVLNGAFGALTKLLAPLGDFLSAAFEDPQQALSDFGDMLKTFVMDRVDAFMDMLGFLGSAIKKTFSGDFEGALEDAQKAGEKYLEANPVTAAMTAAVEVTGELIEETERLAKVELELLAQTKKLEKERMELQKTTAKLAAKEELLAQKAEDSTLSLQEQLRYTRELAKVRSDRFKKEIKDAEKGLEIERKKLKQLEDNGQVTKDQAKVVADLEKELIELKGEYALAEQELATITRQHKSDEAELYLDVLEQSFERQNELLIKVAEDEEASVKDRKEALQDLDDAYEAYYKNVESYFNEYGVTDEQFAQLLTLEGDALATAISSQFKFLTEAQAIRLREQIDLLKVFNTERVEINKTTLDSIMAQEEASAAEILLNWKKVQEKNTENFKQAQASRNKAIRDERLYYIEQAIKDSEGYYDKTLQLEQNAYNARKSSLQIQKADENALLEEKYQKELELYNTKGELYGEDIIKYNAYLQEKEELDSRYHVKGLQSEQQYEDAKEAIRIAKANENIQFAQTMSNALFQIASAASDKTLESERNLGIAQAVANTAIGITKAFATLPYPAAIAASIGIAATGAAQIATIQSAYKSAKAGQEPSSGGSGSINAPISGNTVDTSSADGQGNLEAIQEAISDMGLTVSVSEINQAQNSVNTSQNNSSL